MKILHKIEDLTTQVWIFLYYPGNCNCNSWLHLHNALIFEINKLFPALIKPEWVRFYLINPWKKNLSYQFIKMLKLMHCCYCCSCYQNSYYYRNWMCYWVCKKKKNVLYWWAIQLFKFEAQFLNNLNFYIKFNSILDQGKVECVNLILKF